MELDEKNHPLLVKVLCEMLMWPRYAYGENRCEHYNIGSCTTEPYAMFTVNMRVYNMCKQCYNDVFKPLVEELRFLNPSPPPSEKALIDIATALKHLIAKEDCKELEALTITKS